VQVQLPRLRGDLEFHKRVGADGVEWLIFDPVMNRYHLMGELQRFLLVQMDGRRSVEDIGKLGAQYAETEIPLSAVEGFVAQAQELFLLDVASDAGLDAYGGKRVLRRVNKWMDKAGFVLREKSRKHDGPERRHQHDVAQLFDQAVARLKKGEPVHCARFLNAVLEMTPDNPRASWLLSQVQRATVEVRRPLESPLYFRIKLGNPDQMLKVLNRWIGFLVKGWVYLVLVALFFLSASLVAANYQQVMIDVRQLPKVAYRWPWLVPLSYAVLLSQFIGHEICHGLACRAYGGRVPELGFLFTWGIPGAYCDVSASYTFQQRGHRVAVALAGSAFNFAIYLPTVLVYLYTPRDSPWHFLALAAFYESWLSGVVFLIPFFKDDGYFAISEALGIPNLMDEAGAFWSARMREVFLGTPRTEPLTREEKWAGVYGALNFATTVAGTSIFYFGIVAPFMVGALKGPGLLLGAAPVLLLVFGWLKKGVAFIQENWEQVKTSRRSRLWATVLGLSVVGSLLVPVPQTVTAAGSARGEATVQVRAPRNGVLLALSVKEGDWVTEETMLATLDDTAERAALAGAQSRLISAEEERDIHLKPATRERVRLLESTLASAATRESFAFRGVRRSSALARTGAVAGDDASKNRMEAFNAATEASDVRAQLLELKAKPSATVVAALEAQVKAAEADRSLFERAVAVSAVKAPIAGRVIWVAARDGGNGLAVKQGDPLVKVAPDGNAILELKVPMEDVDLVTRGQSVWLKVDGNRGPVEGKIAAIAEAVTADKKADYLLVTTEPIGLPGTLEGSRVRARIWAGKTTLAAWALRQVRYLIGYQWWSLW
jgi:multidrug efflux pump subunit AcrA (membrane-fusion protein)